jgi:hypothetical protein
MKAQASPSPAGKRYGRLFVLTVGGRFTGLYPCIRQWLSS